MRPPARQVRRGVHVGAPGYGTPLDRDGIGCEEGGQET
ncbi:excalibur calcium-binding domain-containing protein [uncultured Georgenia sp.]|nr:excalibur calcium-binding domain-containing protein [uncultured Georgenia sp.]HLV04881.1 excalibur calcium-binding domain-containing protein [Actinomycetaceae bacterium]